MAPRFYCVSSPHSPSHPNHPVHVAKLLISPKSRCRTNTCLRAGGRYRRRRRRGGAREKGLAVASGRAILQGRRGEVTRDARLFGFIETFQKRIAYEAILELDIEVLVARLCGSTVVIDFHACSYYDWTCVFPLGFSLGFACAHYLSQSLRCQARTRHIGPEQTREASMG